MNENRNARPRGRRPPSDRQNGVARQRQDGSFGNARGKYERYLALARDATSNGDIIEAENCYQHAEHYFRVLKERAN
jgi:Domain of unknown function (DUF4167)